FFASFLEVLFTSFLAVEMFCKIQQLHLTMIFFNCKDNTFGDIADYHYTKYNAYDSGFCFGGKYQFGNGYFLGLDSTLGATGATDLDDKWHNFTMGAIFGYRF
ncbi:MAG: hypothetical protein II834_01305, partial [Bacteroidaceae bacterium]|nr:hypothetical protein [Bacteroidaceae bacterium]